MDINTNYYLYDGLNCFHQWWWPLLCFSCGEYGDGSVAKPDFNACLSSLKKEDEPTMILSNAINLSLKGNFINCEKDALAQAGEVNGPYDDHGFINSKWRSQSG